MLLLRFLFIYCLFLGVLFAQEKDTLLDVYYQTLLDTASFYYEIELKTEEDYVKKILDDDLTLDTVIEANPTEEGDILSSDTKQQRLKAMDYLSDFQDDKRQNSIIVNYRELKESSYISVVKVLNLDTKNDVDDKEKTISLSKEIIVTSYKNSKNNSLYSPFIFNNFDINYLDYFMIYYQHYNFELIKVTTDNYFYKGTLKNKEEKLYNEIQIKVSKKYNIPTKIVLKDLKNKISVSVEVKKVEKIGEIYTGSEFLIYDKGKKITLSADRISLGIPIDIENNYKISFNEYIDLTVDAK
jgi:hypothetical protein